MTPFPTFPVFNDYHLDVINECRQMWREGLAEARVTGNGFPIRIAHLVQARLRLLDWECQFAMQPLEVKE